MKAADDDDVVLYEAIEHPIREPPQKESPRVPVDNRCSERMGGDHLKTRLDRCEKLLPQDRYAGSRTTDRPLRHRLLLPVEGSVASTPGSDLPQDLVPGDPKLAAFLDVSVEIIESAVELCALLRGHGDVCRGACQAIPQSLKEIQTLLRTEAIDLERRVAHNPILSPVGLQGNDGEQRRSPAARTLMKLELSWGMFKPSAPTGASRRSTAGAALLLGIRILQRRQHI